MFVQDVIAAIATAPWSRVTRSPVDSFATTGLLGRSPTGPTLTLTGWSLGLLSDGEGGSEAGNDSRLASSMPPSVTLLWPLPLPA